MESTREIPLKSGLSQSPRIAFLRAEMVTTVHFLARIRYAIDGIEREDGLRIDLGKQTFLDEVPEREDLTPVLAESAPRVAAYVGSVLHPQP